jgi:hypothetical protein
MTGVFNKILQDAATRGKVDEKAETARNWLRDAASRTRSQNTQRVINSSRDRYRTKVLPGRCYLFGYDPKTKDTLPYYDIYPLVFPFEKTPDGFLGLNFHYLPLQYRAVLLDNLYPLVNNDKMDESTRLRMSYKILSSASKFRYFKPCIKHYLNKQVKTRFVYIEPAEWDIAVFLPLQKFVGASVNTVYKDSKQTIRENR